jgi:hypothetical protein
VSLAGVLRTVVGLLDASGVPYMLTGSIASAYYAIPRATQDLDVVILADEGGMERIVEALLERNWYVDRDSAREARRTRGQFNAIDPATGWKVDFIVRKDRTYSRVEFQRRQRATLLDLDVWIASLEDVLLAKLEWGRLGDSALQRRDVVQLLERTGDRLDREYVDKWIDELDLRDEWSRAVQRASSDHDPA